VEGLDIEQLSQLITKNKITCPKCGSELSPAEEFNLMLKTKVGASKNSKQAYLRPETAQSIFINFKRVYQSMRAKLPFGIAQIGRSFRNEISPRQGLIRLRGFTQMEIEVFFDPDLPNHPDYEQVKDTSIRLITQDAQLKDMPHEIIDITIDEAMERGIFLNQFQAFFVGKTFEFYQSIGIPRDSLRFRHMLPEETPFYSKGNFDLEIELCIGWKEAVGIAYRTNHDLSTHSKHSGVRLEAEIQVANAPLKKITPHVVEPSFGVERAIYSILEHAYRPKVPKGKEKTKPSDRVWDWFQIPAHVAPFSAMIFPLLKKPPLIEKARSLFKELKSSGFDVFFDQKGAIGRRYARADEVGTPYCFTIDFQTLEDDTVTIRDRDSMKQIRVRLEECPTIISALLRKKKTFLELGQVIK
ncbi:MAG: glycine--tRNA ligase, partial [Promethearchaeota archaeon]